MWAVEHEMAGVEGLKVAFLGGWVQPSKDIHFVANHTRGMGVSLLRRNQSGRKILSLRGGVDLIQLRSILDFVCCLLSLPILILIG